MRRHESRKQALVFLFENEFSLNTPNEILEFAVSVRNEKISGFARELFLGVLEKLKAIDKVIEENLKTWKKERLSKIVLSILRLGVFEMLHYGTPVDIAIDEAVKLGNEYGSSEDPSYINGVLGAIGKKINKIPKEKPIKEG